jgi:hypothetical protein
MEEKILGRLRLMVVVLLAIFAFSDIAEEFSVGQLHAESQNLGKIFNASRTPASELSEFEEKGYLGQDPWNHPYEFRWLKHRGPAGERSVIFFSTGPNGVLDSDLSDFAQGAAPGTQGGTPSPFFAGDDYGIRLVLSSKEATKIGR